MVRENVLSNARESLSASSQPLQTILHESQVCISVRRNSE